MENLRLYLKESYDELVNHVSWPTWPELMVQARIVIIATIMIALVVLVMDSASNFITNTLYHL